MLKNEKSPGKQNQIFTQTVKKQIRNEKREKEKIVNEVPQSSRWLFRILQRDRQRTR